MKEMQQQQQHGLRVGCKSCGHEQVIPESEIMRVAGFVWDRKTRPKKLIPKRMRPCPYCGTKYGAIELAGHQVECKARPEESRRLGRPPSIRECKYCHERYAATVLRAHQPVCPKRGVMPENVVLQ